MRLFVLLVWLLVVYSFTLASTPSTQKPKTKRVVKKKKKDGATTDSLAEIVNSAENSSNSLQYTTKELREHVMEEWAGKTDEVQGYFDQLPSEEFKENSEDLKFKLYYERKGLKGIDTTQVFNITPGPFRHPPEPMYTIEVNDSYVPKYRITTSEEKRMDEEGTFHSKDTSMEDTESQTIDTSDVDASGSTSTDGQKSSSKNKGTGKKQWPPNMDPKDIPKKKNKKGKTDEKTTKKKETLKKKINNINGVNFQGNTYGNTDTVKINVKHVQPRCSAERNIKSQQMKKSQKKQKNRSIYNNFMEACKLKDKNKEQHRKINHPSPQIRQPMPRYQGIRPYL